MDSVKEITLKVNGMMCSHCEAHVKKALEAIDGVASAAADHTSGQVKIQVTKDVGTDQFAAAIKDAGYEFLGI